MDVEVRAGEVVALHLKTAEDLAFARRALAAFFVKSNIYEYSWGEDPRTNNPIEITKADIFYCGMGNTMITQTDKDHLRLEEPIAHGTYIGIVAGLGIIADGDAALREELLNGKFSFIEKAV